eukprot:3013898-Rhodomonas_salina.1
MSPVSVTHKQYCVVVKALRTGTALLSSSVVVPWSGRARTIPRHDLWPGPGSSVEPMDVLVSINGVDVSTRTLEEVNNLVFGAQLQGPMGGNVHFLFQNTDHDDSTLVEVTRLASEGQDIQVLPRLSSAVLTSRHLAFLSPLRVCKLKVALACQVAIMRRVVDLLKD